MQHEQQREHGASFIECYLKEYGASEQEACDEALRQIANAWKDINVEYLRATKVPTFVLKPVLNLSRLVYILQKDDFNDSQSFLKDEISSQEKDEVEELKEKVRQMLVETPDNSIQKLVLIDAIQRLGVGYHFENEIKTSIQNIFDESEQNKNENDDDDLYVVALRFRLVRQQRHYMSSGIASLLYLSYAILMLFCSTR
ncbi:(E,E)-germacrene B synthase [Capsicum annuum]|nr:(E,E)-germacrene B synthase [Capsicum annuum]